MKSFRDFCTSQLDRIKRTSETGWSQQPQVPRASRLPLEQQELRAYRAEPVFVKRVKRRGRP